METRRALSGWAVLLFRCHLHEVVECLARHASCATRAETKLRAKKSNASGVEATAATAHKSKNIPRYWRPHGVQDSTVRVPRPAPYRCFLSSILCSSPTTAQRTKSCLTGSDGKKKNIVTSGHEKHVTHRLSPICNLIACSVGNNECRPPLATCHLLDTTRVVCPPPPSPHLVSDTLALTTFFFFSTAATGGFHSQSALPASSGQGRNRGQRASGVAVRVRDRQQARDPWKKNKQHTGWGGVGSGRGGRVKTNDLRLTQQPADELRRQ